MTRCVGAICISTSEPDLAWEARCLCGWWGSRDEGFFHAREHRVAVIFREPIKPVPECMRPPRTVREAIARATTQI